LSRRTSEFEFLETKQTDTKLVTQMSDVEGGCFGELCCGINFGFLETKQTDTKVVTQRSKGGV
jgi:hypothetical protein